MITNCKTIALVGLLASMGMAQEPPASPDIHTGKLNSLRQAELSAASAEWKAFLNDQGADWVVRWHEATETPKMIYGSGIDLQAGSISALADARYMARETLFRYAALLRIDPTQFVERTAHAGPRVFTLVYDQFHSGLPVVGGRADVRVSRAGRIAMFGSTAPSIPASFDPRPSISAATAMAFAYQIQGLIAPSKIADWDETRIPGSARLVVWFDGKARKLAPVRLAWEVQVTALEEGINGHSFIDAREGALIEHVSDIHNIDVTGNVKAWVNTSHAAVGALSNTPMHNMQVTAAGVGSAYTDANGDFRIPYTGTGPVNLSVNFGAGRRIGSLTVSQGTRYSTTVQATPGTPAQIQMLTSGAVQYDKSQSAAYWSVNGVNEYCRGILGSIPSATDNIAVRVNMSSTCNAYYTGNSINFYAEGGGCSNTAFTTVITHEWGHGLDDRYGVISQTDGLSEGWGDIVAIYHSGQPIVGSYFRTNGGIVRTALNTRTFPVNSTSVHAQGETWMGFAWDLRNNLMASLGTQAGIARAEEIVIGSMPADATNQPDAMIEVFVQDDDDGNLANGTPNYQALAAAARRRTIPFPEIQFIQVAHTPLTSTTEQLTPRLVQASVQTTQGTVTRMQLFHRTGLSWSWTDMIPGSGANEYIALLPGVLSPQSVDYYIVGTHSNSAVDRIPESGYFTYSVGNESVAFFDNFDAATSNWTHGLVARQDDWQHGSPAGKSGSSQGVSWRDPSSAYSGTRCWANDLGNVIGTSNWNGAYQPTVENWLRSPTINCSGLTGVTLEFQRWLTVEKSQYDEATIRVNGQQVWINPYSSHILDSAWTTQTVSIPQANNNAAVNLEWRLKTDGGLELGGWAIDDVKVYSFAAIPPPALKYEVDAPQVGLGGTSNATLEGTPSAPVLLLFSDGDGPLSIPGLPTLAVGPGLYILGAALDASGALAFQMVAPNDPSVQGAFVYSQALQIDASLQVDASNPMFHLIGD